METVLITGCSSGIGAATARAFLGEGWRVYATARDPDDLAGLADRGCETAGLDVTDGEVVERVIDRVIEESGRIDALVNNAGYGQFGPLEDISTERVHRQFDVNVYGPHRLIRAALPHMREGDGGTIVNVSSVWGRVSGPTAGAYAGSKFALEAMSDALRAEVAGHGVDVVVVEPGAVDTRFDERTEREVEGLDRSDAYDALYRAFEDAIAVGDDAPFASDPEDVAAAILNAASCTDPAARYPVGVVARWATRARFLPDRWRDAVARLVLRFAG